MADAATMTLKAVLLPDEIQATLKDLTFAYTPANSSEKWFYGIINVPHNTGSVDLISGKFLANADGVQTGTANADIATTDKVKFLFIKHTGYRDNGSTANTADSVYINFSGTAVANSSADAVEIGPNESWYCKPGCTIADLNCISGVLNKGGTSGVQKIQCIVAAIIDDV